MGYERSLKIYHFFLLLQKKKIGLLELAHYFLFSASYESDNDESSGVHVRAVKL